MQTRILAILTLVTAVGLIMFAALGWSDSTVTTYHNRINQTAGL